jgi:hypothetical protein
MDKDLHVRTARMLSKLADAQRPKPKLDSTQVCDIVAGDVLSHAAGYVRVISKQAVDNRVLPVYEIVARPLEGDAARQQLIIFRADALSYVTRVLWYRETCDFFSAPNVLHLVSCVSKKRSYASRAEDLYISPLFRAARNHVQGEPWGILSACYGFLTPSQTVEPYDDTITRWSRQERCAWASRVLATIPPARRYVLWAGAIYAEHLAPALNAELPLRGLGIGQRLAWFKAHLPSTLPTS